MQEQSQKEAIYFNPQINEKSKNIKRGINPLIEDAVRRKKAKEQLQQIMREKANLEANRAFINSKSDKVLYDRFTLDFNKVCEHMGFEASEEGTLISCQEMSNLYLQMGFASSKGGD